MRESRATWPLVGRRRELAWLQEAAGEAGAVVLGPAGVGKTRLVAELVDRLRADGIDVVEVVGVDAAASVPFAELLGTIELGDTLASRVVRELSRRPAGSVLVVDDAQLLDSTSAATLHHVIRTSVAPVIVAIRASDPADASVVAI